MISPSASTGQTRLGPYPAFREQLPELNESAGRYRVRFAQSQQDLDAVLRLRFEVFNLELGEGLDDSFVTGRDKDDLDDCFHHLIIEESEGGAVVGTYRMQTGDMAADALGFYSAGEYHIDDLPEPMRNAAVEIGRACVAAEHRNGRVLLLLWRGLAAYLSWNQKRYLFGCCSLTSQDPHDAQLAFSYLEARGCINDAVPLRAVDGIECLVERGLDPPAGYELPPLFESYLNLGSQVYGPPVIDRLFKTIDFLVVLDTSVLEARTYQTFFKDAPTR